MENGLQISLTLLSLFIMLLYYNQFQLVKRLRCDGVNLNNLSHFHRFSLIILGYPLIVTLDTRQVDKKTWAGLW